MQRTSKNQAKIFRSDEMSLEILKKEEMHLKIQSA